MSSLATGAPFSLQGKGQGLGFRGLGFRVYGSGFRVRGALLAIASRLGVDPKTR